jgi:hypothetical protein
MPSARRQLPPPEPAVRQRALAAVALGALSLIALMFGLGNVHRGIYVAVLALLFAVTAIWLGVTASKKARRSGTARPRWAVGGVVFGGIGLAFSALWLLVLAVFWPQLNAYYNCMSGANTVAAQQACHTQFTNSVGGEISVLQNGRLRRISRCQRGNDPANRHCPGGDRRRRRDRVTPDPSGGSLTHDHEIRPSGYSSIRPNAISSSSPRSSSSSSAAHGLK